MILTYFCQLRIHAKTLRAGDCTDLSTSYERYVVSIIITRTCNFHHVVNWPLPSTFNQIYLYRLSWTELQLLFLPISHTVLIDNHHCIRLPLSLFPFVNPVRGLDTLTARFRHWSAWGTPVQFDSVCDLRSICFLLLLLPLHFMVIWCLHCVFGIRDIQSAVPQPYCLVGFFSANNELDVG